ncbi:DUF7529 family protein [Halorussus halophilus]|uniref:DUF7529 family protein n=1 Tax=Halorussus halophilus TaxID=2650975 RepID=UPI001CE4006F|nr:hypothetical protein [Halorussus halophilus]
MSDDVEETDGAPEEDAEPLVEDDPAAAFEGMGDMPGTHLRAMEFWEDVVADMEATAAEYEAEGWETLQLHPGDVTTLTPDPEEGDERFGLDVLLPNDEFDAVEERLEGGAAFDAYEVYSATADALVLLVVAMEDHDGEFALLYPAYYDAQNSEAMLNAARAAGEMHTYLRTLTEETIEFTHADPSVFEPQTGEGDTVEEE